MKSHRSSEFTLFSGPLSKALDANGNTDADKRNSDLCGLDRFPLFDDLDLMEGHDDDVNSFIQQDLSFEEPPRHGPTLNALSPLSQSASVLGHASLKLSHDDDAADTFLLSRNVSNLSRHPLCASRDNQLKHDQKDNIANIIKPPPLNLSDLAFDDCFLNASMCLEESTNIPTRQDIFSTCTFHNHHQYISPSFLSNDLDQFTLDYNALVHSDVVTPDSAQLTEALHTIDRSRSKDMAKPHTEVVKQPNEVLTTPSNRRKSLSKQPSKKKSRIFSETRPPKVSSAFPFASCLLLPSPDVDNSNKRMTLVHISLSNTGPPDSCLLYTDVTSPRKHDINQIREWLRLHPTVDTNPDEHMTLAQFSLSEYLRSSNSTGTDSTITVYTPRIGQKSYGAEKRFFCPSPMALFQGREWFTPNTSLNSSEKAQLQVSEKQITLSNDPTGILNSDSCGGSPTLKQIISSQQYAASFVFKNVYFSDTSKVRHRSQSRTLTNEKLRSFFSAIADDRSRRDFEFFLHVQDPKREPNDATGTFMSDMITLISKPSKKRTTGVKKRKAEDRMCSTELIPNGSTIALYNRLKAQTVSTKCLAIERDHFGTYKMIGTSSVWQPFHIRSVNNHDVEFISYFTIIILECPETGWTSEKLVILPPEASIQKTQADHEDDEDLDPVHQLQKVSLRRLSNPDEYLALSENGEVHFRKLKNAQRPIATKNGGDSDSDHSSSQSFIPEYALWTIVNVSYISYTWYRPTILKQIGPSLQQLFLPITPVPKILACHLLDPRSTSLETNDYHLLDIDISLHGHAILETLDRLIFERDSTKISDSLQLLHFNIFLGNIQCPIVYQNSAFVSDEGEILPTSILDDSVSETVLRAYHIQILCQLPSFGRCVEQGNWWKNIPFLQNGKRKPSEMSSNWYFEDSEAEDQDGTCTGFPTQIGCFSIETREINSPPFCNNHEMHTLSPSQAKFQLPLILVRKADGMIFRTRRSITFLVSI